MSKSRPIEFELPDDLVIDAGDVTDSDMRQGSGSTLPQDLFPLGTPRNSQRDFTDTRPASHAPTQPAALPSDFEVRIAAPEFKVADSQPIAIAIAIVAPKLPTGRPAADGPQPKRVLVVDDDATARLYMRSRLMLRGHVQLLEAASGAQALELVKSQRFDALLLDVDMGLQNGYEVCRAVRSYVRSMHGKQPRIYMITSRSGMLDKMRAKMAGADAFLSKPPHPGELSELLAQL